MTEVELKYKRLKQAVNKYLEENDLSYKDCVIIMPDDTSLTAKLIINNFKNSIKFIYSNSRWSMLSNIDKEDLNLLLLRLEDYAKKHYGDYVSIEYTYYKDNIYFAYINYLNNVSIKLRCVYRECDWVIFEDVEELRKFFVDFYDFIQIQEPPIEFGEFRIKHSDLIYIVENNFKILGVDFKVMLKAFYDINRGWCIDRDEDILKLYKIEFKNREISLKKKNMGEILKYFMISILDKVDKELLQ